MKHSTEFPTHNILGRYCWDCRKQAEPGIPGWDTPVRGPIVRYSVWESNAGQGTTEAVVWANGDAMTKSSTRPCAMCEKHCGYPVERFVTDKRDNYREVSKKIC